MAATQLLFNGAGMSVSGTPGTGTITLNAAISGYLSFAGSGVANGNLVDYMILDGANYETGQGTYTSSGTTLSRTTIYNSTNGGSAISASSSALVYLTASAATLKDAGHLATGTVAPGLLGANTPSNGNFLRGDSSWQAGWLIRAAVKFVDNGTTATIQGTALNVSSVTRNAVGDYTANFTTAFPDANYIGLAMGSNDGTNDASIVRRPNTAQTTTAMRFLFTNTSGTAAAANPGFLLFGSF